MKSRMMYLGWVLSVLVFAGAGRADELGDWTAIEGPNVPILVFVDERFDADFGSRAALHAVAVRGDAMDVRTILTSQSISLQRTGTSMLLARTRATVDGLWQELRCLIDPRRGVLAVLGQSQEDTDSVFLHSLRPLPEQDKAILLRYGPGAQENQLLAVDLATFESTVRYAYPKDGDFAEFSRPSAKISPDGRRLAQMVLNVDTTQWNFTLRTLDLETLAFTDMDPNVGVLISPISSMMGTPPFDWIDDTHVLYQHMPGSESNDLSAMEGTYVLKCADVNSGDITEWLTCQMPLTLDGGSLAISPYTNEIHYHDRLVDPETKALQDLQRRYEVQYDVKQKTSTILFDGRVIYSGYYGSTSVALSASQEYFAYAVRPNDMSGGSVYIYSGVDDESFKIGDFTSPSLAGWIE